MMQVPVPRCRPLYLRGHPTAKLLAYAFNMQLRIAPIVLAAFAILGANPAAAAEGCVLGKVADLPVTMMGLRPTVKAKINGVEASFLFDSGAFFSALTPGAVNAFHLKTRDVPPT